MASRKRFDLYLRMLDDTVRRIMHGGSGPKLVPSDVSMDIATYLPDTFIPFQEAKLDVYRRLTNFTDPSDVESLRLELRDRFGPLPPQADAFLSSALLRIMGGQLGIEGILVRGNEARVTFRQDAVPRLKGLTAAFHEVQFQAEIRRAHPLSLKLTRLGGAGILEGLVRALRSLIQ